MNLARSSTRHTLSLIALITAWLVAVPAGAQFSVSFEKIAQSEIDLVPGRESLNVRFRGQYYTPEKGFGAISMPSINVLGEAVFRGEGSTPPDFNLNSTIGLYVKRPGFPLERLADNSLTAGLPTFAVPGRPAGARFSNFDLPLINNAGDVVFRASFSGTGGSGSGIYATTTTGGAITKIADSFDPVPGFEATPMSAPLSFGFSFARPSLISLNNAGQVVFVATFFRQGAPFIDTGIYGSTVAGGSFVRLADSTLTVFPAAESLAFNQITSNYPPALNDDGMAIFFGGIGPSLADVRQGVFLVPANGSSLATTVARRTVGSSPPLSDGVSRAWTTSVGPSDINNNDLIFHHTFGAITSASLTGIFTRSVLAGPLATVVDDIPVGSGGFAVPGRPGANFIDVFLGAMNTDGEFSFRAQDSTAFPDGIYMTDVDQRPLRVVARAGEVPPGRVAPARFTAMARAAAINASGNLALTPDGQDEGVPAIGLFGLYFFDNCSSTLERVLDRSTTNAALPAGLGVTLPASCVFPCERGVRIFDGIDVRNGGYRAINAGNTIAFNIAYGAFESGAFLAHVQVGGGAVEIVCPDDVTIDCPGDADPLLTGQPSASGCGAIVISFEDAEAVGACDGTRVISRTWTASNGVDSASCVQTITIQDLTPPQIAIPAAAAIACDASSDPADTGSATAHDECDIAPAISYDDVIVPGDCPGSYEIHRSWTATDACGNEATGLQIITVADEAAPLLSVPANATVECGDSVAPAETGHASASDDCSGVASLTWSDEETPGDCTNHVVRVITRTWTAEDGCGNSVSSAQTITVVDTTAPILSVPADVVMACGDSTDMSVTGEASASDGCDPVPIVTFLDSTEIGDCPTASVITRTWTATDACGNSVSATQQISLIDNEAPSIACPPDVTITLSPGDCSAAGLEIGHALATDLCSEPTVTSDAPAVFPVGTTWVTWTATDACGNIASCMQAVTVQDAQAPTISISIATTMLWPPNHDLVSVGLSVSVSDGCDSGIPPIIRVYADEDDEMDSGDGFHSPDARDMAAGTLRLRRERAGNSDGRVYLIVVEAMDLSGNVAMTSGTVVVPHSRSPAATNSVMAQAAAAQAYFTLTKTPPPGFYVVGDGPVIGPKQ